MKRKRTKKNNNNDGIIKVTKQKSQRNAVCTRYTNTVRNNRRIVLCILCSLFVIQSHSCLNFVGVIFFLPIAFCCWSPEYIAYALGMHQLLVNVSNVVNCKYKKQK